MRPLRAFLRDHRWLAIWLVTLALCMKIVVPTGFMVGASSKSLSITICDGQGLEQIKRISLPQPGHAHEIPGDQGKSSDGCTFGSLGMAALQGAAPALLAVALAFILIRGVWSTDFPKPSRQFFLRPPLRAPPARG